MVLAQQKKLITKLIKLEIAEMKMSAKFSILAVTA
jgi:hypothetical protein